MGGGTWVQSWGGRRGDPSHRAEILAGSHPSSSGAVLSIDRMEHPSPTRGPSVYPRYHSNLFLGARMPGTLTRMLLSSQAPRLPPAEGERSLLPVPFPCPTPTKAELPHGPPVTSPLAQTFPSPQMTSHSPDTLDSAPGAREFFYWHLLPAPPGSGSSGADSHL